MTAQFESSLRCGNSARGPGRRNGALPTPTHLMTGQPSGRRRFSRTARAISGRWRISPSARGRGHRAAPGSGAAHRHRRSARSVTTPPCTARATRNWSSTDVQLPRCADDHDRHARRRAAEQRSCPPTRRVITLVTSPTHREGAESGGGNRNRPLASTPSRPSREIEPTARSAQPPAWAAV